MKTLAEQLAEIQTRADRATKGPWYPCGCRYTMISRDLSEIEIEDIAEVCNHFRDESQIEMNKQFIAHSRADIPNLLKVIERLIEQRDRRILSESVFHNFNFENSAERENAELAKILEGKS